MMMTANRVHGNQRLILLTLALLVSTTNVVSAADHTVELYGSAFLPQSLTVDVGDSVTWQWVAGTHTITSGLPGGAVGTDDEPGLLFEQIVDAAHPSFSYTFDAIGISGYSFFDADHPAQIGYIEVLGDELTFTVAVVDVVFEPDDVSIFVGDSIRWQHEPGEMLHTITSGLSSDPADEPGALFAAISSDANPIFVHLFSQAGDYPYFCIPHELLGMIGSIHVQSRFLRGDSDRDQMLTIADPVATLGYLLLGEATDCADSHDSNDDGTVDLADAVFTLSYLFVSGSPPSPPFPSPGPDRTEDALRCFD